MTVYTPEQKREALELAIRSLAHDRFNIMNTRPNKDNPRALLDNEFYIRGNAIAILEAMKEELKDE